MNARPPIHPKSKTNRPKLRLLLAVAVVWSSGLLLGESAEAQVIRGFRPRGAVVIAPPILPAPYYGAPWGPPPVIVPPSSVRVQTPFFSLNVRPGSVMPPPYSAYSYRYESYRPSYPSGYPYRSYRYGASPQTDLSQSYGQYRAGPGGGIPEVTAPPSFSLNELRRAAETLRDSLSRRRDDGEIWLDFLQPDTIIADVVEGYPSANMKALLTRYDGVTMNPKLGAVTRLNGFRQTHALLAAWVNLNSAEATTQSNAVPDSTVPNSTVPDNTMLDRTGPSPNTTAPNATQRPPLPPTPNDLESGLPTPPQPAPLQTNPFRKPSTEPLNLEGPVQGGQPAQGQIQPGQIEELPVPATALENL